MFIDTIEWKAKINHALLCLPAMIESQSANKMRSKKIKVLSKDITFFNMGFLKLLHEC